MRPSTYDRMMRGSNQRRYYQNSGYFNFGYWGAGAKSQQEASDALGRPPESASHIQNPA